MSNETPLSPEAEKLAAARKRNLDLALSQIQKDFGENAIMRLGDNVKMEVDVIPTGNLLIDRALGVGGFARGRIVEIYGPESSGKTTLTLTAIAQAQKSGGLAAFIDVEHARQTHRKINAINLIPEHNVPVLFDGAYEDIPLAEPIEE